MTTDTEADTEYSKTGTFNLLDFSGDDAGTDYGNVRGSYDRHYNSADIVSNTGNSLYSNDPKEPMVENPIQKQHSKSNNSYLNDHSYEEIKQVLDQESVQKKRTKHRKTIDEGYNSEDGDDSNQKNDGETIDGGNHSNVCENATSPSGKGDSKMKNNNSEQNHNANALNAKKSESSQRSRVFTETNFSNKAVLYLSNDAASEISKALQNDGSVAKTHIWQLLCRIADFLMSVIFWACSLYLVGYFALSLAYGGADLPGALAKYLFPALGMWVAGFFWNAWDIVFGFFATLQDWKNKPKQGQGDQETSKGGYVNRSVHVVTVVSFLCGLFLLLVFYAGWESSAAAKLSALLSFLFVPVVIGLIALVIIRSFSAKGNREKNYIAVINIVGLFLITTLTIAAALYYFGVIGKHFSGPAGSVITFLLANDVAVGFACVMATGWLIALIKFYHKDKADRLVTPHRIWFCNTVVMVVPIALGALKLPFVAQNVGLFICACGATSLGVWRMVDNLKGMQTDHSIGPWGIFLGLMALVTLVGGVLFAVIPNPAVGSFARISAGIGGAVLTGIWAVCYKKGVFEYKFENKDEKKTPVAWKTLGWFLLGFSLATVAGAVTFLMLYTQNFTDFENLATTIAVPATILLVITVPLVVLCRQCFKESAVFYQIDAQKPYVNHEKMSRNVDNLIKSNIDAANQTISKVSETKTNINNKTGTKEGSHASQSNTSNDDTSRDVLSSDTDKDNEMTSEVSV